MTDPMTPSPDAARVQALEQELRWYEENMSACYRCDGPDKVSDEPMRHKPGCPTAALLSAAAGEPSPGGQRVEALEREHRAIPRLAIALGIRLAREEWRPLVDAYDAVESLAPLPTPPAPPDLQRELTEAYTVIRLLREEPSGPGEGLVSDGEEVDEQLAWADRYRALGDMPERVYALAALLDTTPTGERT